MPMSSTYTPTSMFINCNLPSNLYTAYAKLTLRLKKSESWRGKTEPHSGFSKEDKEALNAFFFVILTPIFKKELGITCDMARFPVYFFKRLCSKAYLWDSKPDNKEYLAKHIPDFEKKKNKYVHSQLSQDLNKDFVDWLFAEASNLDKDTIKCFEVAKLLATIIEFEEIKKDMTDTQKEKISQNLYQERAKYANYKFIEEILQKTKEDYINLKLLFQEISRARYTFRWQGYHSPVRCSILTHMLESAVLGYFMFIEENIEALRTSTPDENPKLYDELEKSFTVLLFHDIAEIWTDDINSPAKDGIGIREITEQQELEALDESFYNKTPNFIDDHFKNGVMFEDIVDPNLKKFLKNADYFSADFEVWWNIFAGSREPRFKSILKKSYENRNSDEIGAYRTPLATNALEKFLDEIKDIKFFD